jgi:hypothetical protein
LLILYITYSYHIVFNAIFDANIIAIKAIVEIMRNETEKKIKRRDNRGRKKNQATFGVLLIVLHIVISGLYAYIGNVNMGVLDLGSVLTAIFIAMLSIVGTFCMK